MLHLDFRDRRPLYEQIKEKLKALIISGVLKEDEKIPSVRELAGMLTINPNTIQKAYKDLESEGYIYSQKARGSFVAPRKNAIYETDIEDVKKSFAKKARELKFLGVSQKELMELTEKIYKEDEK